jgi:hypothetical protein
MARPSAFGLGLGVAGFLALTDIAGLAGLGSETGPPTTVIVPGALLGVITLFALRPAWRGRPKALPTVIVTRVVSALMGLPAFWVDDAPSWAAPAVAVSLVLTAAAVALLRRPPAREV